MKPVLTGNSAEKSKEGDAQSQGAMLTTYAYDQYAHSRDQGFHQKSKRSQFRKGTMQRNENSAEVSIAQLAGMSQKHALAPSSISVAENARDTLPMRSMDHTPSDNRGTLRTSDTHTMSMAHRGDLARSSNKSQTKRQIRKGDRGDVGISSIKVLDKRAADLPDHMLRPVQKQQVQQRQYIMEVNQLREKNSKYINAAIATSSEGTFMESQNSFAKYGPVQKQQHNMNSKFGFQKAGPSTQSLRKNNFSTNILQKQNVAASLEPEYNKMPGLDNKYATRQDLGAPNRQVEVELTSLNLTQFPRKGSHEKTSMNEMLSPAMSKQRIRTKTNILHAQHAKLKEAVRASPKRKYYDTNNYENKLFGQNKKDMQQVRNELSQFCYLSLKLNKELYRSGKKSSTNHSPEGQKESMATYDKPVYFRSNTKESVKLRDVLKKGLHDYVPEARIDESSYIGNMQGVDSRGHSRKNLLNMPKPASQLSCLPQLGNKEKLLIQQNPMTGEHSGRKTDLAGDFGKRTLNTQYHHNQDRQQFNSSYEMQPNSSTLPNQHYNDTFTESPPVMSRGQTGTNDGNVRGSLRSFSNNRTSMMTRKNGVNAEVFAGAYELSQHEHRLQNKLQSHLRKHRKSGFGGMANLGSTNQNDFSSIKSHVSSKQKSQSVLPSQQKHEQLSPDLSINKLTVQNQDTDDEDIINQELKRLRKNTINLQADKKKTQYKLFYNPAYFDSRLDKMGNLLPEREEHEVRPGLASRNELEVQMLSSHSLNKLSKASFSPGGNDETSSQRKRSPTLRKNSNSRGSFLPYKQTSRERSPGLRERSPGLSTGGRSIAERSQMKSVSQQPGGDGDEKGNFSQRIKFLGLDPEAQARKEQAKKKKIEATKQKERELLYKWAPGTQMGPYSNKFQNMITRYTDEEARRRENIRKENAVNNVKYRHVHDEIQERNRNNLQRRERRLMKADQEERKRRMDEAKGLRRVQDVKRADGDDSESAYVSSNSADSDEEPETKEEQLEDIFNQNEMQVHAMLAEAFMNKGEDMNKDLANALEMGQAPVEMSDKQRIRCMLLIQTFFAGLGDPEEINLKDQQIIARRTKQDFDAQKKREAEIERDRIKREHEAKKKLLEMQEERAEAVEDSIKTDDEDDEISQSDKNQSQDYDGYSDYDESGRRQRRQGITGGINEKIDINTSTKVHNDPQGKRQKMEDAVRKILLFKDMKQSDHKGEMDEQVKLNQDFIKDTIAAYSGAISLPSNIVKKTLNLQEYFLNEGVCQSLSNYFSALTSNHIQELNLTSNGLKDSSMALILNGMQEQRALRSLTYVDNELGRLTAEEISNMLFWPNPTHLETLRLGSLKTNNYSLAILLSALKTNRKLICLDIEKITLYNSKLFEYLSQFLKTNKMIKNLRLSWNGFFPKQIIGIMNLIKRRKTIQYLDLSYNNLVSDKKSAYLVKDFVNTMRRFILRTQIFHLNLEGMNMGKTVTKLVHSIKASSTLNCVHLDMNNVPAEIVYDMDRELSIPETQEIKMNKFRPFKGGEGPPPEPVPKPQNLQVNNNGNVRLRNSQDRGVHSSNSSIQESRMTKQDSMENLQEETKHSSTLKEDLIKELKKIQEQNKARREKKKHNAKEPKMRKAKDMVAPVMQTPLIYQRILNHPEFVFPVYFYAKIGHQKETLAEKIVSKLVSKMEESDENIAAKRSILDPRQDTVYYNQIFANNWTKIEALTQKQIKAGKKGVQPDFSGNQGREGIVKTHHDNCWVCEKRKYVLLAVTTDPSKPKASWGTPITSFKEKSRLVKKYLPNAQMPGRLHSQPIFVSSMNDWFPIHLMPVATFAMLFDYTLVQDIAKEEAMKRDTQDSVTKFQEGYMKILDHAQGRKKMEPSSLRLYQAMWRNYILKNLLYPHDTLFIDFPAPDEEVDSDYLFMWAGFVKPGKHRSLMYDPSEDTWYRRDFFVDARETDLPNFATYENLLIAQENAMESVLSEWRVDTPEILQKCVEHDEDNWRINNKAFIKDPSEYHELKGMIADQMSILKEVFIHTASKDAFPYITMFGMEEFANMTGMIDNKIVKKDAVNRNFIAANVNKTEQQDQEAKGAQLCRYEFIEFLVRMAVFKYKDTLKVTKTAQHSFQMLMKEHILPFHQQQCQDWSAFRDNYLKCTIIDHVMHCNKKGLEAIFVKSASQTKNKVFTENMAFTIAQQMQLKLNEATVRYCWGMCQSTIENETKRIGQYSKITFIEFIEFLCRILYAKFSMDLDANMLGSGYRSLSKESARGEAEVMNRMASGGINSAMMSSVASGLGSAQSTTRRRIEQDEEELKERHNRHLYAYKEFICNTMDPFFDSHMLEFIDPDEDVILSDSVESEFEYDLPSGYDSQNSDNPEFIPVLTSGSENFSDDDWGIEDDNAKNPMLDFEEISNKIIHQMKNPPRPQSTIRKQHDHILQKQKTRTQKKMMKGSNTTSTAF